MADGESLARSKQYQEREVRNILDAMNELLQAVAVDGVGSLISADLIADYIAALGVSWAST